MKTTRTTMVKCTGHDIGQTRNGHPQIILQLQCLEAGEGTDPRNPGEDITMFQPIPLDNDKSREFAIKHLRLLGMSNNDIFNPEGLGRLKARCVEVYEYWEGKGRWKATYINPPTQRRDLDDDMRDQFQAMLAAELANEPPIETTEDNEVDILD